MDKGITVNCCHPGAVATNIGIDRDTGFGKTITGMLKPFFLTPSEGAKTAIFLATDESVKDVTGEYFYKCRIAASSRRSKDKELAKRLYDLSERLVSAKPKEDDEQENKYDNRKEYNISVNGLIDKQKLYELVTIILKYVTPNKIQAYQYKSGHRYRYFPKRLNEAFEEEFGVPNKRKKFILEGDEFDFRISKESLNKNISIYFSAKYDLADKMSGEIEKFILDEAIIASESDYTDEIKQNRRTVYLLENGGETPDPNQSGICGFRMESIKDNLEMLFLKMMLPE